MAVSSFRETEPVGYLDQPRFLNAAAAVETSLEPQELLAALLEVERELGRTRERAHGTARVRSTSIFCSSRA